MSGKQCGFKNVDPNQMASFQMKPSDQDANCYLKEDTLIQMASLEYLLLKQSMEHLLRERTSFKGYISFRASREGTSFRIFNARIFKGHHFIPNFRGENGQPYSCPL